MKKFKGEVGSLRKEMTQMEHLRPWEGYLGAWIPLPAVQLTLTTEWFGLRAIEDQGPRKTG